MKKLQYFYAIAALALFGACTAEEGLQEFTSMDETRGSVKTEFTISFPSKAVGTTRMTEATIQGQSTPVFRGIQDIHLFPFKTKVASITGATEKPGIITLAHGTVATFGASDATTDNVIASSGALFTGNNAHLYKDVEIEIGTQSFIFYGMAIPATGAAVTNFDNGTLTHNLTTATTLADITFSPVQINTSVTPGATGSNSLAIANYLTAIAQAHYNDGSADHYWSASENVILKTLYQNFITMKAGSWTSVKATVQQLYSSLKNKTFVATIDNSINSAILDAILLNANVTDSNNDGTLEFTANSYDNYPNDDLNLPDGAAYVNWTGSEFVAINFPQYDGGTVLASGTSLDGYYTLSGTTYTACSPSGTADGTTTYYKKNVDNTGLDITDINKFVYPAPLYYRVMSDIRTADESKYSYYNNKGAWDDGTREADAADHDDVLDGYGPEVTSGDGQNDIVKSSTRSIAIVKQVQYAVGRLDATVKASTATLQDNANTSISLASTDATPVYYFPVTGILIGGQKPVDYKFEQKTSSDSYTIYDKVFENALYLKSTDPAPTDKTHTLVFETKEATSDDDPESVTKIAVEFLNNSDQIIVGRNNTLILPGTKFYLVGVFDPYDNTSFNYTGTSTPIRKTFVQDYTTTANLVIQSFRNAYNTLPDLRAPQLELGLSIDMNWQNGITQTVTIE